MYIKFGALTLSVNGLRQRGVFLGRGLMGRLKILEGNLQGFHHISSTLRVRPLLQVVESSVYRFYSTFKHLNRFRTRIQGLH